MLAPALEGPIVVELFEDEIVRATITARTRSTEARTTPPRARMGSSGPTGRVFGTPRCTMAIDPVFLKTARRAVFVLAAATLFTGCVQQPTGAASTRHMADAVTSADGIRIAYETQGQGTPALIFVHGWSCD